METTKFVVGGVAYDCPPLNFYWQRQVQADYLAAIGWITRPETVALLDRLDQGLMAESDALALLEGLSPLIDAALKIVVAAQDQVFILTSEQAARTGQPLPIDNRPTFDQLSRALTPSEQIALVVAFPAWVASQQPKGEAAPAGATATRTPDPI